MIPVKTIMAGLAALLAAIACANGERPADNGSAPTGETEATPAPAAEIGATGGMCGGVAGFQCEDPADYCAMEPGQCVEVSDAAGVCAPRPEICTQDYRPVCGCDERTYANACVAASAGVSVASEGVCQDPPSR